MTSNECWLGFHDHCSVEEFCDCVCHVGTVDWDLELEHI